MPSTSQVFLGRETKVADDYFQIGDAPTLSKSHARIFWDELDKSFKLQNLSKNKIQVNQKMIELQDPAEKLKNMSSIVIAQFRIFFLQ